MIVRLQLWLRFFTHGREVLLGFVPVDDGSYWSSLTLYE